MNQIRKILYKVAALAAFSIIQGQIPEFQPLISITITNHPPVVEWDRIAVNPLKDIYLLDKETGIIIRLDAMGNIRNESGGIGYDDLSFSDPIDIATNGLELIVSDKMANTIAWFDRKLQPISKERHTEVYPDQLVSDVSGNVFLLSRDRGLIWRRNLSDWDPVKFIDLFVNDYPSECIRDLSTNATGNLGLLYCNGRIIEYSATGRIVKNYILSIPNATSLIPFKNRWLALGNKGQYEDVEISSGTGKFPLENPVDTAVSNQVIYMLANNHIYVFAQ